MIKKYLVFNHFTIRFYRVVEWIELTASTNNKWRKRIQKKKHSDVKKKYLNNRGAKKKRRWVARRKEKQWTAGGKNQRVQRREKVEE